MLTLAYMLTCRYRANAVVCIKRVHRFAVSVRLVVHNNDVSAVTAISAAVVAFFACASVAGNVLRNDNRAAVCRNNLVTGCAAC